jgi:hypothetical protein
MKKRVLTDASLSLCQEVLLFIELLDDYLFENQSEEGKRLYDEESAIQDDDDVPF